MSVFERYLRIWVFLCIIAGIGLSQFLPNAFQAIGRMEVAQVNLQVGLLIWVMIIPMLVKLDFGALHEVRKHVVASALPCLWTGWSNTSPWLSSAGCSFAIFFAPMLPAEQIDSYIAGLILLAAAPCTAMVFERAGDLLR